MVDPGDLQIRADQNEPPFTYNKEPIESIAIKEEREKTVYAYVLRNRKWIVYNATKNSPMFMKIALENPPPSAEPMSLFYERFTKPDLEWLDRNRWVLV